MLTDITVTLNEREARALANTGSMWADVLGEAAIEIARPDGVLVSPLESAVMKLTVALVCEGVEL